MTSEINNTSKTDENKSRGLGKVVIALCYVLLVVVLFVTVFLGLKSYGNVQMQTSVGYAVGHRSSANIFSVLNNRQMDDVIISVMNAGEGLTLLPEKVVRRISIELQYKQFVDMPDGTSKMSYETLKATVIEFVDEQSANEYYEQVEKNEARDQFVVHCYYFDLLPDEDIVNLGSDYDTAEYNDYLRHNAVMDIRRIATGFGPYIYKLLG